MAATIVAVFDSLRNAEEARKALVKGGIPGERIAVKSTGPEDTLADEAPGQTYKNQPGQPDDDHWTQYGEILRIGKTVVSVEPPADRDKAYIKDLLRRSGASHTEEREDWRLL